MAERKIEKLKTGTTTVGVLGDNFVVLAAEIKATMGYLVASKHTKKILKLDKHAGMTIAGNVGDAQALERYIKAEMKLYELDEARKISIKAIATLVSNILYARSYFPYYVQLLIGGHDSKPRLFSFDPTGSVIEEKDFFSTGSGSVMALGVLEDKYKEGIDLEGAKKLAVRAVRAAIERDIASGGTGIDLAVVTPKGFEMASEEEAKNLMK
ncbi:MAG: archaeal proteasome endopeptidase complex subunit beta [Candidatus Aenigmatarchaeota archaeon]|nr:MAG: archaeal proteasome endopeptidase complex subunit beta [Candidatus Aenigmarchaeota archaeon]